MAWADVANKIKFYGSEDNGLDGLPAQVNGPNPLSRRLFKLDREK